MPEADPARHHVNELDRLRRQMRLKDLSDMVNKLENLKAHAKSSQEIIGNLEDIRENLEYLEAEVSHFASVRLQVPRRNPLATNQHSGRDHLVDLKWQTLCLLSNSCK